MNTSLRLRLSLSLFSILPLMLAPRLEAIESTNVLHFPVQRFSIAPLEAVPGEGIQQPLIMCLPVLQGFAANVNVQVQPFTRSIEDYKEITLNQFKAHEVKVIETKVVGTSQLVFEYSGQLQGQALHWYARALKSSEHVYLVTATGLEQQWAEQGPQLKHCVDSFRFDLPAASAASTR